jgi:large subunit ribosomal protein L10
MRAAGAGVQVAKNRLVKIAVQGTEVASISELMRGPTLIAYSDDPVAAPKAAVAFAKENDKLVILGGAMGATSLNVDAVRSLATLPSLDELRGKLVGIIVAPATKLAQLTTAPAAKLARVFAAYGGKDAA